LATAQLVCLLAASLWYARWLRNGLTQLMCGQVAAVNSEVITELTSVIDEWNVVDLSPGSHDRNRLQRLIERFHLPNRGSISVLAADTGAVLCSPQFLDTKESSVLLLASELIRERRATAHAPGTISRWYTTEEGTHYISVHDMPRLGIVLVADQREDGIVSAIDYMSTPVWRVGLLVAGLLTLLSAFSTVVIIHRYDSKLERVNAGLEQTVEKRSRELLKTREAVIFGLAKLADSRDADTGQHLERIREYVAILARRLAKRIPEINHEYVRRLQLASSLHDIGKVGIRDDILLKPGRLTPDERKVMQTHAAIGARCLAAIQQRLGEDDFLGMAVEIACSHHERFDGGGYPYGLKGEEIPLSARIVAVADVYDALTTHRVYKPAIDHDDAARLILSGAGAQFDPVVVEAFRSCQKQFKQVAAQFSSGFHTVPWKNEQELADVLESMA
jgi:response regulator RpfG family c-di-GMP phosphodiesterase